MANPKGYRQLPQLGGTPRDVAEIVNSLRRGKVNSVVTATLGTGTSTTVSTVDAHPDVYVGLTPLGDGAAADMASVYVKTRTDGYFVLAHPSASASASAREYVCVLLG